MEKIEKMLDKYGAFLKGHFVLASGRHSGEYIDKFKIYGSDGAVANICEQIVGGRWKLFSMFSDYSGNRIEVVLGPERGGKILARKVARQLQSIYPAGKVLAGFTKKDKEGNQFLGEKLKKKILGKKVLIVDDILTTGGTVKQIIEEVRGAEGRVLGVAVICNRGNVQQKDIGNVPIFAQIELEMEDWPESECPLCQKGIPVNQTVGRGKNHP